MSSDRDEQTFNSYFGGMPAGFLAVPYSDTARKDKLNKRFKVSGIPSVVLVQVARAGSSDESAVLSTDGRSIISGDPGAEVSRAAAVHAALPPRLACRPACLFACLPVCLSPSACLPASRRALTAPPPPPNARATPLLRMHACGPPPRTHRRATRGATRCS